MKNPHYTPIHFFAKVGKPELVYFITLSAVVFLPFIFNLEATFIPQILITLFIFSIQYYINTSKSRYNKYINFILLLTLVLIWVQYFVGIIPIYILYVFEILLMIISFYYISKSIFYTNEIGVNTLIAAVSGYLLIGISMGLLVLTMQTFRSDHFSFSGDITTYETNYFSFVTMSTLGYGDVLPLSKSAKGLSIIITLIGQFYMAIIMGLIIGKLIAPKKSN